VAKVKNLHLYGTPEQVKAWKEEYDYSAKNQSRIDPENPGHLIVFAFPPKNKKEKKKVEESTEKGARPRRGNGYSRHKNMVEQA